MPAPTTNPALTRLIQLGAPGTAETPMWTRGWWTCWCATGCWRRPGRCRVGARPPRNRLARVPQSRRYTLQLLAGGRRPSLGVTATQLDSLVPSTDNRVVERLHAFPRWGW